MADRFAMASASATARRFDAGPSDSTSRWTPCPPRGSRHEAAGICPASCLRIPPARVRRDFHPQEKRPAGRTSGRRRPHQHGASVPRTNVACGFPALRSTERLPVKTGPQTDDELQDDGHGCSSGAGASVFPAGTCHATSVLLNRVRIPSLPPGGPPSHHQRRLSAPLVPHARRRGSRGSHRGSSLP
jgi:hypothetical protein